MPMIGNRLQIRAWPAGTAADSEDTIRFAMTTGVETRIET
jgi:propanol-preferring alcohol dehydrogenase